MENSSFPSKPSVRCAGRGAWPPCEGNSLNKIARSMMRCSKRHGWSTPSRPSAGQNRWSNISGDTPTNHRIVSFSDGKVSFRYKDYRDESKTKIMTLDASEFIRRFSLHILPKGFVRIRHYGILSSSRKQKTLPLIHQQLGSVHHKQETMDPIAIGWKQICSQHLSYDPDCCPVCKKKTMITILVLDKRGPPQPELIQSRIRLQPQQP